MTKGYTDEKGMVTFLVEEGIYSWKASKEGYGTKWGKVTITKDTTIEIELPLLSPPVSLSIISIPLVLASIIEGIIFLKGE